MKLSLRALFGWVALAALIIAALAQPSLLWMRVMFTLALGFVAVAAAGAILAHGKPRAFWTGAALCSALYLLALLHVSQGSIQGRTILARSLLTQHLLDAMARARGMTIRSEFDGFELWDEAMFRPEPTGGVYGGGGLTGGGFGTPGGGIGSYGGMMEGAYPGYGNVGSSGGTGSPSLDPAEATSEGRIPEGEAAAPPGGSSPADPEVPASQDSSGDGGVMSPPGYAEEGGSGYPGMPSPGGMAPLPGTPIGPPAAPVWSYASYNHFMVSGHCAFVALLGIVGGFLARVLFGRDGADSPNV
jgi:hypothetical protein